MLYSMLAFGPDSQPVSTSVTKVKGPAEPLTPSGTRSTGLVNFSPGLEHCLVGGCWATWSNGYAGDVYDATSGSIKFTVPAHANAFYFYVEPNKSTTFTMSATTGGGTTSGPIPVDGYAGARYFGFYTTGAASLKTITVTSGDPTVRRRRVGTSAPYQFILPASSIKTRLSSLMRVTPRTSPSIFRSPPEPPTTPLPQERSRIQTPRAPAEWEQFFRAMTESGTVLSRLSVARAQRFSCRGGNRARAHRQYGGIHRTAPPLPDRIPCSTAGQAAPLPQGAPGGAL